MSVSTNMPLVYWQSILFQETVVEHAQRVGSQKNNFLLGESRLEHIKWTKSYKVGLRIQLYMGLSYKWPKING